MKSNQEFAIVGMAGNFPCADDLQHLWKNLMDQSNAISEVPSDRWRWQDHYDENEKAPGKSYSKWGAFLKAPFDFDPMFFRVSPTEARFIDPQQRLVLETAWQAFEHANISPSSLKGSNTGVFVGASSTDYGWLTTMGLEKTSYYSGIGTNLSVISNRVSFAFDFHGPSITVDSACSSSLTALHSACNSLALRDCDHAVVGAANILLSPIPHVVFSGGGAMARDGQCKTFDASADGFVRGEGGGALIVKRLEDAERDGNRILATILSTGTNQDGMSNGISSPNGDAQAALLTSTWEKASIRPEDIGLIETHGTGTLVGDPIEVNAIRSAFDKQMNEQDMSNAAVCYLSSVKANLGHLESAAGMLSIIKVLLSFQHGEIPPQRSLRTLNPKLKLGGSHIQISPEVKPWPDRSGRCIAGVSSFSFGGTNAHILLEAPLATKKIELSNRSEQPALLVLSVKTRSVFAAIATSLLNYLNSHPESHINDVLYTLQYGREALNQRIYATVSGRQDVLALLEQLQQGDMSAFTEGKPKRDPEHIDLSQLQTLSLEEIGQHWLNGVSIDWAGLQIDSQVKMLTLPGYPFNKRYFGFESHERFYVPTAKENPENLLQGENHSTFNEGKFVKRLYGSEPFLADHVFQGSPLMPAAAYIAMVVCNAQTYFKGTVVGLSNVMWLNPLQVPEAKDVQLRFSSGKQEGKYAFYLNTLDEKNTLHCRGQVHFSAPSSDTGCEISDIDVNREIELHSASSSGFDIKALYQTLAKRGINFGASHQTIKQLWRSGDEDMFGLIDANSRTQLKDTYLYPPGIVDGLIQAAVVAVAPEEEQSLFLPFSVKKLLFWQPLPNQVALSCHRVSYANNKIVVNFTVYDMQGKPCMSAQQFTYIKFHEVDNE